MASRFPSNRSIALLAIAATAVMLGGWSLPAHAAAKAEAACRLDMTLKAEDPDAKPERWRECAQAPKGGSKKKAHDACEGFKSMATQNPDQELKLTYLSRCSGKGLQGVCRGAFGSVDRYFYQSNADQLERHRNGCATSGGEWENIQ